MDEREPGVVLARRNIAAWRRVLLRYYGETKHPSDKKLEGTKTISILDLLSGKVKL